MDVFEMLVLGVEAGFALAGFAGILATLQFVGAKQIHRADAGLKPCLFFYFFLRLDQPRHASPRLINSMVAGAGTEIISGTIG